MALIRLNWVDTIVTIFDKPVILIDEPKPVNEFETHVAEGPTMANVKQRGTLLIGAKCPAFMYANARMYILGACVGSNEPIEVIRVEDRVVEFVNHMFQMGRVGNKVVVTRELFYVDTFGVIRRGEYVGKSLCRCVTGSAPGTAFAFIGEYPSIGSPVMNSLGQIIGVVVSVRKNVAVSVHPWELTDEAPDGTDGVRVYETSASGLVKYVCGRHMAVDVVTGVFAVACRSRPRLFYTEEEPSLVPVNKLYYVDTVK